MIRQFIRKQKKMVRGFYVTYLAKNGQNYNNEVFWDASFYTRGISDRQTMSSTQSPVSAKYHYCSVELQILKHIFNNNVGIHGKNILDIGSGSGHWIDFYKSLGSDKTIGIDVSKNSIEYLEEKYSNNPEISLYNGKAIEILDIVNRPIDIVNAIGVMFHIVDDDEWATTIKNIANILPQNGIFIIGGHFGIVNGLNVQLDKDNYINKRLRSRRKWKSTLKKAGFSNIHFCRNNAYLWIKDTLPENNILIAAK